MLKKSFIWLLVLCMALVIVPITALAGETTDASAMEVATGNVAKVGDTEYATIDEAIANWTNGTTLTLLSDVTLSDVVTLKSTEHHILDLGTYTMTAASQKDAIQIENCARSSAGVALDIKADATNPGGITATGKAIVRTAGKSGVKDRPIIRFYGGVFNASYIVYHSGSNGTNCPQFQFHGGEFNGTIFTNRALNQFYGGVFTGSLMMSVDSSAYTLVAGGTFKQLSNLYMSALNSDKFTIGSSKGANNGSVCIDENGNYVISTTTPTVAEASVASNYSSSNYFYYSTVNTNGMYYEDVYDALEANQTGVVTVFTEELDLTDSSFTGTIVVPAESTLTIKNAPATLVVKDTEGNVLTANANGTYTPPKGNDFNGYTGGDTIWGEVWGNANESFVIKVVDANGNVMGTTSLNNVGGIIDGDVNVTWTLKIDAASNTDEYWTMEWTTAPTIDNMPAKVELWVDGVKVSGGNVVLNGPDEIAKIYAAVADADGTIKAFYTTLAAAIDAAQEGEIVALLRDFEQADGIIITDKNITVDLNGYTFTVTEGASTNNRNFKINGTSVVTIKNGTMVAKGDYSSGAYGTVRTEGSANVTLTGLKLYNYRGNGLNIKALTGTTVTISDTEIYATYGGGIEAAGGIIIIDNVIVDQKGMYTAPYNSMAISVNGGGKVTVKSGKFSTECLTAEEANNQGSSHGPWVAGVLNSGGTLIINGGTFSNDNFGDNSLATAARGAILADTGAVIEINGGTFKALKAVIDIQNNLGDASKNPTGVISGGIFSADPTNGYVKIAEGYEVVANDDGTYGVEKPMPTVNGADVVITDNGNGVYDITLATGTFPADGVDMTFPAKGDASGMAYVVHEHNGKYYIYVGKVSADGNLAFKNTVGFSTFTVYDGGFKEVLAVVKSTSGSVITLCDDVAISGQNALDALTGDTLDLNGYTLTVSGNSYFSDGTTTFKNGNIVVEGYASDSFFCGYTSGAILVFEDVVVTGDNYSTGCAIFNANLGKVEIIDSEITVSGDTTGGVIYGGISVISNSNITATNVCRGVTNSVATIENGTSFVFDGGETGLNNSDVTVDGSTVTIKNVSKRAVRLNNNTLALVNGSTLSAENCAEDIVKYDENSVADVNVSEDSTLDAVDNVTVYVAMIGTVKYEIFKEALLAAAATEELTVIQLLAGEFELGDVKFPASLKNVIIKGADGKQTVIKNSHLYASDGNTVVYEGITFDGIVFDGTNLTFTGARNGEVIYKDWTITNCEFKNVVTSGTSAIHFNLASDETMENFTFTNNVINGVSGGSASGLRLNYVSGNVTITGNDISNVVWNAIQLINSQVDTFVIENNTIASNNSTLLNLYNVTPVAATITNNKFLLQDGQYAITGIASGDVSGNYWGGNAPAYVPAGVTFNNYYADEALTSLIVPAAKIGNGYYASIAEAIAAAQDGDTVTILPGEYAPINISYKNITIQGTVGANGELLTTIKGGNPAITGHGFNGTIKDLKIVDAFKVMYAEPAGNVTVDNIYVTGATYGLHLVAYAEGLTWTIQNSYMDLRWANSFGVYGNGDAAIVIKGNTFEATDPYYEGGDVLHVNSFLPNVTITENVFGENAKIRMEVTDTSKLNISGNYHADGVDNAFSDDSDVKPTICEYYTDKELTNLVKRYVQVGTEYFETLEEAVAAAQAGDEIILLSDVTLGAELTLPAGVILNGNGQQINGNIVAGGDLTFKGYTKVTGFNAGYSKPVITIGEGATLETTTGRMVIGHGATFNIIGTIADAKTANVADLTPSLIMPGASFTGAGVTFNVTNAYIKVPTSYCSSSKTASGTFDFNITNSIWESAGKLAFEAQSTAATVNFDLKDSVLTTGSHLVFGVSRGEIVIDNSNVNVGTSRQIENQSTLIIKNGSVVNGAVATSSNAKNPGTIIVENATYAVTGEFSGSDLGTGTIIVKNGATFSAGSITKANIQVDATGMQAGDVIDLTANLEGLTGTLEVINNDKLEAQIVDGKIVLSVKPVAEIDGVKYETLEEAFKAATSGCTIKILTDVVIDYKWDCRYTGSKFTVPVTIEGDGHTLKFTGEINDGYNFLTVFHFQADATVQNLTIDMSEAQSVFQNRFTAIANQGNLKVDKCTFIGSTTANRARAIIYGESASNLGEMVVTVTDSKFENWGYGVTDNMAGKDGKSVTITGNTFTNSKVTLSAAETVVFNNNTVDGAYVKITSYAADNALSVTATGNTLTANGTDYNYIEAKTVVAQDGFMTPVAKIGGAYYVSLESAIAAAQAGETITLLADIALDGVITIDEAITLDLGGKTVTGADGAIVFNIKADTTIMNGTILGNKSGTSSGLIDIYANLTLDGVTVETSKINALRFKDGGLTATLTNCNVTGAFKGYGASVWNIVSGTYKASSTAINDQLNGTASISGGTFHYAIDATECAPGYAMVDNGDGTYGVKYAPVAFVDANNNGVLDDGEVVYGSLEAIFDTYKTGDVYIVLIGDAVVATQVDTDADAKYYLNTNVAEGVTVEFAFADDWNYVQKMYVGENVTIKAPYLLAWTELEVYGTIITDYLYITVADVLIAEGAVVTANTGDATVQVKNGATLTVNGELNTAILNVWAGESKLVVNGANAKVNASWIDIWDGNPSVNVENGATLEVDSIKASRGGSIAVDNATLDADNIELGHNGTSAGDLTVTNGTVTGEVKLTAVDSVFTGSAGMNVTTDIADHKVVYENGQYKVVAKVYVAEVDGVKFESLAEAITAAQDGDIVTIFAGEYTQSLNVNKAITVVGETDAEGNNLVKFNGGISISADGAAVKNITASNPATTGYNCTLTIGAKNVLVEGCVITDANAMRYSYTSGTVTFRDCVLTAEETWVIHFDGNAGGEVIVENCEVNGWIGIGGGIKVTFQDSKFNNGNWAGGNLYGTDITIDGCEFNNGFKFGIVSDGANVTVTDSTMTDGNIEDLFRGEDIVSSNITVDGVKLVRVAKIGDTYYETLADAIAAAQAGETVTLLDDVALSEAIVVAAGQEVVLDLAGYTISMEDASNAGACAIRNNGTLTIKDSVGNGKITFNSTTPSANFGYSTSTIFNAGVLIVDGGAIENTTVGGASYAIDNTWYTQDVSLTVNGGEISATKIAVRQVPFSTTYKNVVTINGGTLTGATAGLQTHNYQSSAALAEVNIHDGVLNGTYAYYTSYTNATTATATTINIDGGEFNGYLYLYNGQAGSGEYPMNVAITGGTFNEGVYVYTKDADGNEVNIPSIAGGTFAYPVEYALCKDGYIPTENGDGTYGVKVGSYETLVNGVYYESFAEALAAAQAGDTITLVDNVTHDEFSKVRGVTIDLNGYTLSAPEGIVIFKDANIIDSGETKGLLAVPEMDLLIMSGTEFDTVPVWNEEGTGFVFVNVKTQAKLEATGNDRFVVTYRPSIKGAGIENDAIFGDGALDNGLNIKIVILCIRDGVVVQDPGFAITEELIADSYTNNKVFTLSIRGASTNYDEYRVEFVIESAVGATYTTVWSDTFVPTPVSE